MGINVIKATGCAALHCRCRDDSGDWRHRVPLAEFGGAAYVAFGDRNGDDRGDRVRTAVVPRELANN